MFETSRGTNFMQRRQSAKTSKERLWYLTSFIAPSRLCVKFVSLLRHLAFYAEAAKKASVAKKGFS
jgi:hypothetical protein